MNRTVPSILIILSMSISANAGAAIIAQDNAADPAYADGWRDDNFGFRNGGFGFEPWDLGLSYPSEFSHFIDRGPLPGNGLGAPAFGMASDNYGYFESDIWRGFAPLTIGTSFEMDFGGAVLADNSAMASVSVTFWDRQETLWYGIFSLGVTLGEFNNHWAVSNPIPFGAAIDTGIPTAEPFHMSAAVTAAGAIELVLSPIDGGPALFSQSYGGEIDMLWIELWEGSTFFFNDLQISVVPEPSSAVLGCLAAFFCWCIRPMAHR